MPTVTPPGRRTQMLRLPGGHVEDRTVDARATHTWRPRSSWRTASTESRTRSTPAANDDNLYELTEQELKRRKIELLPANVLVATRNLSNDDVIRKALGNTGTEDYVDYYEKTKQEEWKAHHEQVTPWEGPALGPCLGLHEGHERIHVGNVHELGNVHEHGNVGSDSEGRRRCGCS